MSLKISGVNGRDVAKVGGVAVADIAKLGPVIWYVGEDLELYTEVDAGEYITVTQKKATAAAIPRTADAYLYKDYGADYFNGFEIWVDGRMESTSNEYGVIIPIMLSNVVDDACNCGAAGVKIAFLNNGGNALIHLVRGPWDAEDHWTGALNTTYYFVLKRTAGSDTITCETYSDAARTSLVKTFSVAGFGTGTKYRYLYAMASFNSGESDQAANGFGENLKVISP